MNLQTQIRPELWQSISKTYEAKNFSHAVLDAMHHVSNLLRDKTGTDGDGVYLVGHAFGGEFPRLMLNKLQTETEKNVQKGVEHILRGLYMAIRNPRSHEQTEDDQDSADAIICFIDYLLGLINKSEEPFTVTKFVASVLEPDFAASFKYTELLAAEIPSHKRLDSLIALYRNKSGHSGRKLGVMVNAIVTGLGENEIKQFLDIVSEELRTIQDDETVITILQMLPHRLWPSLSDIARLRIEYKVIKQIEIGKAYAGSKPTKGILGTWAANFLKYFSLKRQVSQIIIEKLGGEDEDDKRYITRYFMPHLPDSMESKIQQERCITILCKGVRQGHTGITAALVDHIDFYPADWREVIIENLQDLTDLSNPAVFLLDGTPFLTKQELPF